MRAAARYFRGPRGQVLRALIGHAQLDQTLHKALIDRWLLARRKVTHEFIREGIASRELRADLDPDMVLDTLYGPLYHQLLLPYDNGKSDLSDAYVNALIEMVFTGLERE